MGIRNNTIAIFSSLIVTENAITHMQERLARARQAEMPNYQVCASFILESSAGWQSCE
jgi:predicted dithiol-disulfide oxidoreductase (DUF899 family)